jgi:hypothetical protein
MKDGIYFELFAIKDGVRYNAKIVDVSTVSQILENHVMNGLGEILALTTKKENKEFDAVNMKTESKPKRKPDAIYLGFSNHDCESHYKCPLCGHAFGSWSINMKDVRCPNCKEELGGIR